MNPLYVQLRYRDLVTVAGWLLERVGLAPVQVLPLTPAQSQELDGMTDGHRIWLAVPSAPLHAVAHEVAHLMADDGHGPRWRAAFMECCRLLSSRVTPNGATVPSWAHDTPIHSSSVTADGTSSVAG